MTTGAVGVERVTGIEPALSAWEADVLPLNYTREPRQPTASQTNKHRTSRPQVTPLTIASPDAMTSRRPGISVARLCTPGWPASDQLGKVVAEQKDKQRVVLGRRKDQ
jgi:hypothetical protein